IHLTPDFQLGLASPTITVQAGAKARVRVIVWRLAGFAGNVTVTPPAPVTGITPKPSAPLSTTGSSVTFKLKVGSGTPAGTYNLVFTATDDSGRQQSATLALQVVVGAVLLRETRARQDMG